MRRNHPELADATAVVGSLFRANGGMRLHVRFDKPSNVVVLNVAASEFEAVDQLEPRLHVV